MLVIVIALSVITYAWIWGLLCSLFDCFLIVLYSFWNTQLQTLCADIFNECAKVLIFSKISTLGRRTFHMALCSICTYFCMALHSICMGPNGSAESPKVFARIFTRRCLSFEWRAMCSRGSNQYSLYFHLAPLGICTYFCMALRSGCIASSGSRGSPTVFPCFS